ncbi:MAG: hypothetical protein NZ937_04985 [Armatimonadetes bacterium]|nr:hypothetical protein [Armatimonadota bacterium]
MINKEIGKDEILVTFCIIDSIIKALGMQGDIISDWLIVGRQRR